MIYSPAKRLLLIVLVLLPLACQQKPTPPPVAPAKSYYQPWEQLPELFALVQEQRIFADGKTFVDCRPNKPVAEIKAAFAELPAKDRTSIAVFVKQHFELPLSRFSETQVSTELPLRQHLVQKWDMLTRKPDASADLPSTLIPLPAQYVVPGGRFREIYYWDSYFTMQGLAVSDRADLISAMVANFAHLIDEIGYIPNGNRSYFLGRSQPPFFAGMVGLLAETDSSAALSYLPQIEKEYDFWMDGAADLSEAQPEYRRVVRLAEGVVLNRYYDDAPGPRPESYREDMELAEGLDEASRQQLFTNLRAACESGWDFSTRWFADPADFASIKTTRLIPVDLNCLLYRMERMLATMYAARQQQDMANRYTTLADNRKQAILTYCWDAARGFFADYDLDKRAPAGLICLAGYFPLYMGIATAEQADAVKAVGEQQLLYPGGFVTTTRRSGQQWDAPNGWAPHQWIAIRGLERYGHSAKAKEIAHNWLRLNEQVYRDTGKMMEKYNVQELGLESGGGEYPTQDGFGWTNGIALALMHYYDMPPTQPE